MLITDVPAIHYVTTTHHVRSEGFSFDVDVLADHVVLYGVEIHPSAVPARKFTTTSDLVIKGECYYESENS